MSKTQTVVSVADTKAFAQSREAKVANKYEKVVNSYQDSLAKSRAETTKVATDLVREKNAHNETKHQLAKATSAKTGGAEELSAISAELDRELDRRILSLVNSVPYEDDPEIVKLLAQLYPNK